MKNEKVRIDGELVGKLYTSEFEAIDKFTY